MARAGTAPGQGPWAMGRGGGRDMIYVRMTIFYLHATFDATRHDRSALLPVQCTTAVLPLRV